MAKKILIGLLTKLVYDCEEDQLVDGEVNPAEIESIKAWLEKNDIIDIDDDNMVSGVCACTGKEDYCYWAELK